MSDNARYTLWVEFTDRGEVLRAGFPGKSDAIFDAKKYWLTRPGLFRAFVRDTEDGGAVVYDRVCDDPAPKTARRVRESYKEGEVDG